MSKLTPHQRLLKKLRADKRAEEKFRTESAIKAISALYIMLVYTMYFFYGWKTERLRRVLKHFRQIYESIISGERSLEALADEIKRETKIEIDVSTGSLRTPDEKK